MSNTKALEGTIQAIANLAASVADSTSNEYEAEIRDLRAQLAEAKSANESLMNERTSYIATARDNYARLESKLAQANTVITERDAQLAAALKRIEVYEAMKASEVPHATRQPTQEGK